jgi:tetratricopeptide (TPR) repeat protein
MAGPQTRPNVRAVKHSTSDAARTQQLMTFGDRLFRAGNYKKAEERYQQAMKTGGHLAAPYVRLAQLALVRGNYADAADRFREAEVAQPGWIITAPDIQPLFGEPTEFSRQIGRIESYVQAHPQDRNAWLVLGAEWFLSGRTSKAADVFRRLDDPNRKPDVALSAFLDASNRGRPNDAPPPGDDPQSR